jgi:hypothetical protein
MKQVFWISGITAGLLGLLLLAVKVDLLPIGSPWVDVVLYSFVLFAAVWAVLFAVELWPLTRDESQKSGATNYVPTDSAGVVVALKEIKEIVQKAATASTVTAVQTNVGNRLADIERNLLRSIASEAVKAVESSELGGLRSRLADYERTLAEAKNHETSLKRQIAEEAEKLRNQKEESASAGRQLDGLVATKLELERRIEAFSSRINECERLVITSRSDLETKKSECEEIRAEAARSFSQLVPLNLKDSELAPAISVFYVEAVTGQPSAISVWCALTTFGSTQADPAARDFQLQIVRRLGTVLVQYWKQKGLNEKERHENLSVWAKCLNEHADGRYNLFVPGLGSPIDRNRMACATSATSVREVLCWQVRNPTGANFSLADVA